MISLIIIFIILWILGFISPVVKVTQFKSMEHDIKTDI